MELAQLIFYIFVGWMIGFVGGMVGLVLGAIRFPFVLGIENSVAPIVAGTNLAISTLGATTGAIRHHRQKNIDFRVFVIMAFSGAAGSFMGAFLVESVPLVVLLSVITIIISYEAFDLAKKSGKMGKRKYRNSDSLVQDREKDGKNDSMIPLDNVCNGSTCNAWCLYGGKIHQQDKRVKPKIYYRRGFEFGRCDNVVESS